MTVPAGLDVDQLAALERHESGVHALIGRELRDLGDAVLVTDPVNPEPFWNRLNAIRWPADPAAFDRRLDQAITLFATLDRLPHVWPRMIWNEPADLVDRLRANGFVEVGGGHTMVLSDPSRIGAATAVPAGVTVERYHRVDGALRARAARDVARLSAEAFDMPEREAALEEETAALFDRLDVHAVVAHLDGEPAAVAKRATFDGLTYLSSIGTATKFRGRGLGRLVTAITAADGLADRSRWVHLGVFADNRAAIALYESLGFVTLGPPAPDLLQT
jgi:ribosomal protein S18 acetylase RimI-like enzyme